MRYSKYSYSQSSFAPQLSNSQRQASKPATTSQLPQNGPLLHPNSKPTVSFPSEALNLSFPLLLRNPCNRRGKTRLAKWYAPYNDEEKIKLKGEVSCIKPVLYASSSIPHCSILKASPRANRSLQTRSIASSHLETKNINRTLSSSATTRSCIGGTQASSSARAWMRMITSWRIWRRYISLLRCWIAFSGMFAS